MSKELVEKLSELMDKKNLSVPMVALAVGVSKRTLYRWLRGEGYQEVKMHKVLNSINKLKINL